MNKKRNSIDCIKIKVAPILKNAGVLNASIFGSFARGEQTETSDVDLLVEFPQGKTLFDLVDLKMRLEEVLGTRVDVVTPNALSPKLLPFIQNELIQIL